MEEQENQREKPSVIIMDVYETLLDMSDMERKVNQLLDSSKAYALWFELFMQYCFVDNLTNQYHSFVSIAKATMQMASRQLGRNISDADFENVLEYLKHLPVHENVPHVLSQLNDAGFRIAALTNSPVRVVNERMEPTGLISYFEMVLSSEQVKRYKPAVEVYNWAAKKMMVAPEEVLLVSAHGWDIAGAANAGMQTAYLKQSRQILYPLAPEPTYLCSSLNDLMKQLGVNESEGVV